MIPIWMLFSHPLDDPDNNRLLAGLSYGVYLKAINERKKMDNRKQLNVLSQLTGVSILFN